MQVYRWNVEKNRFLEKKRGITFDEIVERISSGAKVTEYKHPNQKKYPKQNIMIIEINSYAYLALYVKEGDEIFLKTIDNHSEQKGYKKIFER